MKITLFCATDTARAHMLEKHAVHWYEVREIMTQPLQPRRLRTVADERRYYVKGKTEDGRPLKVIIAVEPPHTARVITAFEERRSKER